MREDVSIDSGRLQQLNEMFQLKWKEGDGEREGWKS